jgi:hypothetical protein
VERLGAGRRRELDRTVAELRAALKDETERLSIIVRLRERTDEQHE